MRKIKFQGIPSGDGECFCFAVDKETFIRIKQRQPDKYDVCPYQKNTYMLYPETLFFGYETMNNVEILITPTAPDPHSRSGG